MKVADREVGLARTLQHLACGAASASGRRIGPALPALEQAYSKRGNRPGTPRRASPSRQTPNFRTIGDFPHQPRPRVSKARCFRCARGSQQDITTGTGPGRATDRKEIVMTVIENIHTIETEAQGESATAAICENAALFGATPERGEFDPREIWDRDDATDALGEAFRILAQGVAPDGFQIADERESLLWGIVNAFDAQVRRLDRGVDKLTPELRDLQSAQDGSEVKSRELELVTDRARNLGDRRDAFEQMRDTVAEQYRAETGETWRPRYGSNVSQTGKLTSASIDARDFMRARKDRETRAHLPEGTLIAIAGGRDVADPAAVIARLDQAKAKCANIVLVHGGGPGVERIAARWAERNGVHQVVCKPDWNKHRRAAPFRRNEEMLNLLPAGVIAFPGSGITDNLVDRARQLGITVDQVAA